MLNRKLLIRFGDVKRFESIFRSLQSIGGPTLNKHYSKLSRTRWRRSIPLVDLAIADHRHINSQRGRHFGDAHEHGRSSWSRRPSLSDNRRWHPCFDTEQSSMWHSDAFQCRSLELRVPCVTMVIKTFDLRTTDSVVLILYEHVTANKH